LRDRTRHEVHTSLTDTESLAYDHMEYAARGVVTLDKKVFKRLVESMGQMDEIVRGVRAPSREFCVDAAKVKEIRAITGLSQPKFAKLLHVDVGTLRNWEQGRREPTGPAQALLRAIKNNPQAVLKALAA
jgi:putative transcriptional regulator